VHKKTMDQLGSWRPPSTLPPVCASAIASAFRRLFARTMIFCSPPLGMRTLNSNVNMSALRLDAEFPPAAVQTTRRTTKKVTSSRESIAKASRITKTPAHIVIGYKWHWLMETRPIGDSHDMEAPEVPRMS
jgi:hypothetical protein